MTVISLAIALISTVEGYRDRTYCDFTGKTVDKGDTYVGVLTIGFGRTTNVKPGDTTTQEREIEWLKSKVQTIYDQYRLVFQVSSLTIQQQAACISLIYNIGSAEFRNNSSVYKYIWKQDLALAAASFRLYNKQTINGQKVTVKGLIKRREIEERLFCGCNLTSALLTPRYKEMCNV